MKSTGGIKVTSVSMPASLHKRFNTALYRYGDKSRLIAHLIERWLDNDIQVSQSVVRRRVVNNV